MKTLFLVTAAALCLASHLLAQDDWEYRDVSYIPNPYLPFDSVEITPDQPDGPDVFYYERPAVKPAGLPATFVLVSVFKQQPIGHWKFCGWIYMDASLVDALHESEERVLL